MAARKNVRRNTRRTDGSDTARDVLGWIKDQVEFWSGDGEKPGQPAGVTQARDVTRAVVGTGATALDAYYTGGMAGSLARNVIAPRATVASPTNRNQGIRAGGRQFARDAAVTAATAGAAYGAARAIPKVFPKLAREVGVHVSQQRGIDRIQSWDRVSGGRDVPYTGKGPGEWVDVPSGKTFKVSESGTGLKPGKVGKPITSSEQAKYAVQVFSDPGDIAYVTRSPRGVADPNAVEWNRVHELANEGPPLRMTGSQRVVGQTQIMGGTGRYQMRDVSSLANEVARQRQALANARTTYSYAAGRTAAASMPIATTPRTNSRRRNVR